ncbi:ATP phosphoribosyltransferase regulatory subunit [Brucella pseudogrignonensis]|uniref:ATP phosphoribosyltransferase regulatory subunit n=1 Tax=Brucella pseudogrignonensis TaxID=419475 RepID=UPI000CFBFF90|nr:ATP phosphoribosyltransferase regulatory subunit [Brucella pseudogrignonensis]MQP42125.1 ATP phosphoribosyltransferase regulatory subunit [Ochrobactrum sp. MYb237]PQZ41188.1 ATP phosphoribosyltransferase regulatory subunit [Brucella pseudogrignonensis]PRA39511.1 ATP phosphoribosyltransferase regulatory subunit [Brucella pseudogrignonensis]PRA65031.1 ATP phosphoribosyltransferase regulatory subunit [Brucella pseudogrignonensis]
MAGQRTSLVFTTLRGQLGASEAELVDIPLIQPADPFLDMAGEDLRRRIFLTENENGDSLCLRPEFTIPVCRNHIALNAATPKRYAYLGEVFRQRRDGAAEFLQAGIEDLGATDEAASDARSIADALACVHAAAPNATLEIVLGDQSVFAGMLKALGLPQGWRKKLLRAFGDAHTMEAAFAELTGEQRTDPLPEHLAGLVAEGDEAGLARMLEAEMLEAGMSPGAGRTPAEIARRLIEKEDLAAARFPSSALEVLKRFLSTRVSLEAATITLRAFAADNALDLSAVLQKFEARTDAIIAAGIPAEDIVYDASFGRPLDYYTGLVYEIRQAGGDKDMVLAGGGRYDRLLTMLGASENIPGVGFSIWLDRLEALSGEQS